MPTTTWLKPLPTDVHPLPQVLNFAMPYGSREEDRRAFQELLDKVNELTYNNQLLKETVVELRAVITALP
jgi:hypothetical protein